jgi:hypothetical protein
MQHSVPNNNNNTSEHSFKAGCQFLKVHSFSETALKNNDMYEPAGPVFQEEREQTIESKRATCIAKPLTDTEQEEHTQKGEQPQGRKHAASEPEPMRSSALS